MSTTGPFGLWMGLTVADVQIECEEVSLGKYTLDTVPRPHSAFERYVLQITPGFGLSWIKAIGKNIQTSVYGTELLTEFDALEQRLTSVYGKGDRTDFLAHDSIWNEPRDWMMAILNKERWLMTIWSSESGSPLKDSLASIGLVANALGSDLGYLSLEYTFENSDAADAALTAAEDQVL